MTERERHPKKGDEDRQEGLTGLEDAQRRKAVPRLPAIRILEALDERYEKSTNPLGLSKDMPMKEYVKLYASGKLAEIEREAGYVDRWLTEEELFAAAMGDHAEAHGHYGALGSFNEAMRGLKDAQLISKGPFKKTWLVSSTSPVHSFLGALKAGERFTTENLADYAGKSTSWAAHKLKATGKLRITRRVGVRLHERL